MPVPLAGVREPRPVPRVEEVVPVLLAIPEEDTRALRQLAKIIRSVAVRDVVPVHLRAFQNGDEELVEAVGRGDLRKIAVRLRARDLLQMQMRVRAPPALRAGIVETPEGEAHLGRLAVRHVDLDAPELGLEPVQRLEHQPPPSDHQDSRTGEDEPAVGRMAALQPLPAAQERGQVPAVLRTHEAGDRQAGRRVQQPDRQGTAPRRRGLRARYGRQREEAGRPLPEDQRRSHCTS